MKHVLPPDESGAELDDDVMISSALRARQAQYENAPRTAVRTAEGCHSAGGYLVYPPCTPGITSTPINPTPSLRPLMPKAKKIRAAVFCLPDLSRVFLCRTVAVLFFAFRLSLY